MESATSGDIQITVMDNPHCVLSGLLAFGGFHSSSRGGSSPATSPEKGCPEKCPNFTVKKRGWSTTVRASYRAYHVVFMMDISSAMFTITTDTASTALPIDTAWEGLAMMLRCLLASKTSQHSIVVTVACTNASTVPLHMLCHVGVLPDTHAEIESFYLALRRRYLTFEAARRVDISCQRGSILGPMIEAGISIYDARPRRAEMPIIVVIGAVHSTSLQSCVNALASQIHRTHCHVVIATHCAAVLPRQSPVSHLLHTTGAVMIQLPQEGSTPESICRALLTRVLVNVTRMGAETVLGPPSGPTTLLYEIKSLASNATCLMLVATVAEEYTKLGWCVVSGPGGNLSGSYEHYTVLGPLRFFFVLTADGCSSCESPNVALCHRVFLVGTARGFTKLTDLFGNDAPYSPQTEFHLLQDLHRRDTILFQVLAKLSLVATAVNGAVRSIMKDDIFPIVLNNSNASGYSPLWKNLFEVASFGRALTVDRASHLDDIEANRYGAMMQFKDFKRALSTQLTNWVGPCGTGEASIYGMYLPTRGGLGGLAILQMLSPSCATPRPVYPIEIRISTIALCGTPRQELFNSFMEAIKRDLTVNCGRRVLMSVDGGAPSTVWSIVQGEKKSPITSEGSGASESELPLSNLIYLKKSNPVWLRHPLVPPHMNEYYTTFCWRWDVTPSHGNGWDPNGGGGSNGITSSLIRQRLLMGYTLLHYDTSHAGDEWPYTSAVLRWEDTHGLVAHYSVERDSPYRYRTWLRAYSELGASNINTMSRSFVEFAKGVRLEDNVVFSRHATFDAIVAASDWEGMSPATTPSESSPRVPTLRHSPNFVVMSKVSPYRPTDAPEECQRIPFWLPLLHPDGTAPLVRVFPPFGDPSSVRNLLQLWAMVTVTDIAAIEEYAAMGVDAIYIHVADDSHMFLAFNTESDPYRIFFYEVARSVLHRPSGSAMIRKSRSGADLDGLDLLSQSSSGPTKVSLREHMEALMCFHNANYAMCLFANLFQPPGDAESSEVDGISALEKSAGVMTEFLETIDVSDCARSMGCDQTLASLHTSLSSLVISAIKVDFRPLPGTDCYFFHDNGMTQSMSDFTGMLGGISSSLENLESLRFNVESPDPMSVPVYLRLEISYQTGRSLYTRAVMTDGSEPGASDKTTIFVRDNTRAHIRVVVVSLHHEYVRFWGGDPRPSLADWMVDKGNGWTPLVLEPKGVSYNVTTVGDAPLPTTSSAHLPSKLEGVISNLRQNISSLSAEKMLAHAFADPSNRGALSSDTVVKITDYMMQCRPTRVTRIDIDAEFCSPYNVAKEKFLRDMSRCGLNPVAGLEQYFIEGDAGSPASPAGSGQGGVFGQANISVEILSDNEEDKTTNRWLLGCVEATSKDGETPYMHINIFCYERDAANVERGDRAANRVREAIVNQVRRVNTGLLLAQLWRTRIARPTVVFNAEGDLVYPELPAPTVTEIPVYSRLKAENIFHLFCAELASSFEITNRPNCYIFMDEGNYDCYYVVQIRLVKESVISIALFADSPTSMTGSHPRREVLRIHNMMGIRELLMVLAARQGVVSALDVDFLQNEYFHTWYVVPPPWAPSDRYFELLMGHLEPRMTSLTVEDTTTTPPSSRSLFAFPPYRGAQGAAAPSRVNMPNRGASRTNLAATTRAQCVLTTSIHTVDATGREVPRPPRGLSPQSSHMDADMESLGQLTESLPEASVAFRLSTWTVSSTHSALEFTTQRRDIKDKYVESVGAAMRDVALQMFGENTFPKSRNVAGLFVALHSVASLSSDDSVIFSKLEYSASITHSRFLATLETLQGMIPHSIAFLRMGEARIERIDAFTPSLFKKANDFVGAAEGIEAYIVWCTTSDLLGAAMKPTTNALHATAVPLDLQAVLRPPTAMYAAAMFHLTRRGCRIVLQNCTQGFSGGNAFVEKMRPLSRVFDVLCAENERSLFYNVALMQGLGIYLPSTMQYLPSYPSTSVQGSTPASPGRTNKTYAVAWCASMEAPTLNQVMRSARMSNAEHGTQPIGTFVLGSAHPPPAIASLVKHSTGVFPVLVTLERHGWLDRSEDGLLRAQSHRVAACVAEEDPTAASVEEFFKTHKHKVREEQGYWVLGDSSLMEDSPLGIDIDDTTRHIRLACSTYVYRQPGIDRTRQIAAIVALWHQGRALSDDYLLLVLKTMVNMRLYYSSRSKLHMMESVVDHFAEVEPGEEDHVVGLEESAPHKDFVNRLMQKYMQHICAIEPDFQVKVLDGSLIQPRGDSAGASPLFDLCRYRVRNRHGVLMVGSPPRKVVFFPGIVYFTKVLPDGGVLIIELGFKGTTVAFDLYAMDTTSTVVSAIKSSLHFNSFIYDVQVAYVFDCIKGVVRPLPYSPSLSATVKHFVSVHPFVPRFSQCIIQPAPYSMSLPSHTSGPTKGAETIHEAHLLQPRTYNEIRIISLNPYQSSHEVYRTCAIAVLEKDAGQHEGTIYVVARRVLGDNLLVEVTWASELEEGLRKVHQECARQLTNSIMENESTAKLSACWKRLLKRQMPYDEALEWTRKLYQTSARGPEPGLDALSAVPVSGLRSVLPRMPGYIPDGHTRHWIPSADPSCGILVIAPPECPDSPPSQSCALLVHVDGNGLREVLLRCQARILSSGTVVDLPPFDITAAEYRVIQIYISAMFLALWVKL